jgi:hypothetical protein
MATFRATLAAAGGDGPRPALVTVDRTGLSVAAEDRPIGRWRLDEVVVDVSPEAVIVGASGGTLTFRLEETVRFAREVERLRAVQARPSHPRALMCGGGVAAVAVLAALVVVAPWIVSTITVVGGGASVIGGGLGLADPGVGSLLPGRLTPVRLIVVGVALLATGLWMDLVL